VRLTLLTGLALAGSVLWGGPAWAQAVHLGDVGAVAPRAPDGRLEVSAEAVVGAVKVDGMLDDRVWRRARPVTGFVQAEPHGGSRATQRTQVWVAFDRRTLYIAAYCHDTDVSGEVVNDISRDFVASDQDAFAVILDTFGDRRNGYEFITNPEGAKYDAQIANEGRETNQSWDAVWRVRAHRGHGGWTVEMAIPFRSIRFAEGRNQVWGINFERRLRRNNEVDYWSPVPRAYDLSRVSLAGDLVGLPTTSNGHNLRVKPYVAGSTLRPTGGSRYTQKASFGVDLKYGVTDGLTLDLTGHPDFAQAEADQEQVNLTQFPLYYPEKRDFFLENAGLFYVGDQGYNNRVSAPQPDQDLILFFSRRIGLTADGQPVPIVGGARITGHQGRFGIGAFSMQTQAAGTSGPNNYSVVRVRRDILGNSDVGAVLMMRQNTDSAGDYNRVYGVDANLRIAGADWSSYYVRTQTPGLGSGQFAWRTSINREWNVGEVRGGVMTVGRNFNDDIGFYRRTDSRKWFLDAGLRPRPRALQRVGILEMHPHIHLAYYTDLQDRLVASSLFFGYTFFLNDGGYLEATVTPQQETLSAPFTIHVGSPDLPAGAYNWTDFTWKVITDPSKPFNISAIITTGGLWSGSQTGLNITAVAQPSYRFNMALGLQRTAAKLHRPEESWVKTLWTLRTRYSFSTKAFLDALLQYDADQRVFNANVRFDLIHGPLSHLYLVYNEQRSTLPVTSADWVSPGRSLILKFTQMFSF
jgi:Domain of unknown function (DUF5916)/Carbohydrate family 9 binding domain-like